jgi:hypothetical protein
MHDAWKVTLTGARPQQGQQSIPLHAGEPANAPAHAVDPDAGREQALIPQRVPWP